MAVLCDLPSEYAIDLLHFQLILILLPLTTIKMLCSFLLAVIAFACEIMLNISKTTYIFILSCKRWSLGEIWHSKPCYNFFKIRPLGISCFWCCSSTSNPSHLLSCVIFFSSLLSFFLSLLVVGTLFFCNFSLFWVHCCTLLFFLELGTYSTEIFVFEDAAASSCNVNLIMVPEVNEM